MRSKPTAHDNSIWVAFRPFSRATRSKSDSQPGWKYVNRSYVNVIKILS